MEKGNKVSEERITYEKPFERTYQAPVLKFALTNGAKYVSFLGK